MLPWSGDERWSISVGGVGNAIPFVAMPQSAISVAGDRAVHIWSEVTSRSGGTFTVSAFKSNGDTMFVRTFPFVGVPIPQSARDSAIAAQIRPGNSEVSSAMMTEIQSIARRRMPAVYAGVESVLPGVDNTFWVGMRRAPDGQAVLVLNSRGDPVASIMVPPHSRLRQASANQVWMTETDRDGLVSVVRYRVSGVSCGALSCR